MQSETAILALSALAHADRMAAFRLVLRAGKDGVPSGRIADRLDIQPTRMSFHLSTLERAAILRSHRDGRHIRYAVNVETMRELLGFLTEDCCGGHPEICTDLIGGAQATKKLEEIS